MKRHQFPRRYRGPLSELYSSKAVGLATCAGFDDAVVILAALDSYTDHLRLVRSTLWQIVSPLYYVAEAPYSISSDLKQHLLADKSCSRS